MVDEKPVKERFSKWDILLIATLAIESIALLGTTISVGITWGNQIIKPTCMSLDPCQLNSGLHDDIPFILPVILIISTLTYMIITVQICRKRRKVVKAGWFLAGLMMLPLGLIIIGVLEFIWNNTVFNTYH
jgi:hypothetical protein